MRVSFLFDILFFLLLSALSVSAQDFAKGEAAFHSRDYDTSLKELLPLAQQGDARAQNIIGVMYNNGNGVFQDYSEALKWYRAASEQGNSSAQGNMAYLFLEGNGVPQNYLRALMWINIALAKSGLPGMVRDEFEAKMTPDAIEKSQEMAKICLDSLYKNCGW